LISVLLENKHRLIKSDDNKSPKHAAPSAPGSVVNGDVGSSKSESKPSSVSAGHTPQSKHRSVISMPQPTEPSKRDSSVFDMIAGTKSEFYGNLLCVVFDFYVLIAVTL
jgi:hypothetical protein